ncbi:hypothetical protein EVA_21554, partial [gut metagenome]
YLVKYAEQNLFDGKKTIQQVVEAMEKKMERDGLASVAESSYLPVNFAMPRKQEIFACLNRYRGLAVVAIGTIGIVVGLMGRDCSQKGLITTKKSKEFMNFLTNGSQPTIIRNIE